MSRYCKQCGQELVPQAQFCPKCGLSVEDVGNTKGKKVVIGIVTAILSAVIVIIAIFLIVTSMNAYKKPFKYLEKGINTRNEETILKAFPSGGVNYNGVSGFMQELRDYYSTSTYKIEVLDKKKIDKQYLLLKGFSLEYLNSVGIKSKKGYLVTIRIDELRYGSLYDTTALEMPVFKADGKWVLIYPEFFN